jgi:protocatechuate 3,4-dioxygenase beta subunit
VDEGFQGYGEARTAAAGTVAFRTIRPTPYAGRTPHIHLKLRHASLGELTTQLFVEGEPGNAGDFLWRRLSAVERTALSMRLQPARESGLRWQCRHVLVVPA